MLAGTPLFITWALVVIGLSVAMRWWVGEVPKRVWWVVGGACFFAAAMGIGIVYVYAAGHLRDARLILIYFGSRALLIVLPTLACWLLIARREILRWQWRLPSVLILCVLIWLDAQLVREFQHLRHSCAPAKVARAKSEIRNLAVALEKYYIENNSYPPAVDGEGTIVPFSEDGLDLSWGHVPWLLTTPVGYQSSIPHDPFRPREGAGWSRTYRYATKAKEYWIMASAGPDLDQDMLLQGYIRSASGDITRYLTQYGKGTAVEYDPTNGVMSSGDVFRTGP